MLNQNKNMNQDSKSKDNSEKLHRKIKETWSGLNDSDIKLYDNNREKFFDTLKEKHNVPKEDAKEKMHQLEKDCGCSSTSRAA